MVLKEMLEKVRGRRKGSEIISVFGECEIAAAEQMLREHPTRCRKIPLEMFPSKELSPDIWVNSLGLKAKFAVLVPKDLKREFEERIANLRA